MIRSVAGALALLALSWMAVPAGARPVSVGECAACHGEDGIARDVEVPHLAGQNERYLYNQMLAFRSGKRPHKEMRVMSRQMTNEEMAALAAYYAALPPR